MKYRVNFGYDSLGGLVNRYYATMEEAVKACSDYFKETGIVLSIEEV